jgi:hypothetical protein
MKVMMLENGSRMMHGGEMWGIEEGWKETGTVRGRFSEKVLRMPRCAANKVAELELGRDTR